MVVPIASQQGQASMRQAVYPAAIIAPSNPDHAFGVLFPDVPGCHSGGASVEQSFTNAIEALESHLGLLVEAGETLPPPSSLDQARAAVEQFLEPDEGPIAAMVLVPATLPGRTQRFNITMDENLVARIDAVASNRSAFLADAARAELRRRQESAG